MGESRPPEGAAEPDARRYWRANLRLIAALLAVWALVSYGFGILWVEPLNRFTLGGFPLGFWFSQQGAIYVFVLLILVYAVAMDRIDRRYGVDRERARAPGGPVDPPPGNDP